MYYIFEFSQASLETDTDGRGGQRLYFREPLGYFAEDNGKENM